MVSLDLRAPSGAMLAVGMGQEVEVSTTATDVRFVGRESGTGLPATYTLQMGSLGFQDVANEAIMLASVAERFVVDGREVRLAHTSEGGSGGPVNSTVAVIGQWHEAMLVYGGFRPTREEVTATLTQFVFDDTVNGMSVRPRSGTGLEQYAETVKIVVEERGSISVFGRGNAPGAVPAHAGAATRYGEIWRAVGQLPDRPGTGANCYLYLVGTTTAFAEVVLDYQPVVDDRTLLAWLDSINLEWR
jgi:hypothetical protein